MALTNSMAHTILQTYFTDDGPQYVALHITDPTNAGLADTELTTTVSPTYSRQPVTWTTPDNRSVTNTNELIWSAMPVISIGFLAVWSALTGGILLAVFEVSTSLDVVIPGGTIRIPADSIAVTIGGSPQGSTTPGGDGIFGDLP